jgi:hydrogenase-4 component F
MIAVWTIVLPTLTGILCLVFKSSRLTEWIHLVGSTLTAGIGLYIVYVVETSGSITSTTHLFYMDALSAIIVAIISIIGFAAALHSVGYVRNEVMHGIFDHKQAKHYYFWFQLFIGTMMMVTVFNNLGLLWVSIEATTIVSSFLIMIYRKGEALEAAWKYLMICSAGIVLALLGIILFYMSSIEALGSSNQVLDWTVLSNPHLHLQPGLVKLGFVFILIGFGTKIGLAPMHFWLPDAHSQAPSPVSALLSGVLLNCALLGLIRFGIVAENTLGGHFVQNLLIGFGLLSVIAALPFILVQHDYKRMLAFSTVEHMGIIVLAIGIGGVLGFSAAVLQMFNHAMGKSLLFLSSGNISQKYRSKHIARVSGVIHHMPFTGITLLVGTLAIVGVPPFSIFTSEFAIFNAGFNEGHTLVTSILILLIAIIFAAMIFHINKMTFGGDIKGRNITGELSRWSTIPLLIPLAFVVTFGTYEPNTVNVLIHQATHILLGGRI